LFSKITGSCLPGEASLPDFFDAWAKQKGCATTLTGGKLGKVGTCPESAIEATDFRLFPNVDLGVSVFTLRFALDESKIGKSCGDLSLAAFWCQDQAPAACARTNRLIAPRPSSEAAPPGLCRSFSLLHASASPCRTCDGQQQPDFVSAHPSRWGGFCCFATLHTSTSNSVQHSVEATRQAGGKHVLTSPSSTLCFKFPGRNCNSLTAPRTLSSLHNFLPQPRFPISSTSA
jgi:hypothetical protein